MFNFRAFSLFAFFTCGTSEFVTPAKAETHSESAPLPHFIPIHLMPPLPPPLCNFALCASFLMGCFMTNFQARATRSMCGCVYVWLKKSRSSPLCACVCACMCGEVAISRSSWEGKREAQRNRRAGGAGAWAGTGGLQDPRISNTAH